MSGEIMNERFKGQINRYNAASTLPMVAGKYMGHGRINPASSCNQYWAQSDSPLNLSGVKGVCGTYPHTTSNLTASYNKNYGNSNNNNSYYSNRIRDYKKQYYPSSQRQSDYYNQLDIQQNVGASSMPESNRHLYQTNMSTSCVRMGPDKYKTYTEEFRNSHQGHHSVIHQNGGSFSTHTSNGQMHYSGAYSSAIYTCHYHPYGNQYNHSNNRVPMQNDTMIMSSGVLKGNKKRVKNMFTALFAHCQVCGDRATGFHYGADTCEACKVSQFWLDYFVKGQTGIKPYTN